jgi:regulator of replication initiation timing
MVTKRYAQAQRRRIIELEDDLNAANAYIATKGESYDDLAAENERLRASNKPLRQSLDAKVQELVTANVEVERLRAERDIYKAALQQISDGEDPFYIAKEALNEPS